MQQTELVLPKDLLPEVQALYLKALDGLSISELRYAFEQALTRCRFFPVPMEILQFADEYRKSPAFRERMEQLDRELHERYRQRTLTGEPQKVLVSILDYPEHTVEALQASPQFKRALRNMRIVRPLPEIPTHVAERKGPEWEARLQEQALELKRKAAEQESA